MLDRSISKWYNTDGVIYVFGDIMKSLRSKKGLSQQALSSVIGIPQSSYASYELERREPDLATLQKIATYFGVSCDYLLTGKPYPIRTYGDFLLLLLSLADAKIGVRFAGADIAGMDEDDAYMTFNEENDTVYQFFDKWRSIYELRQKGTVDEDIYRIWIDKTLNEYGGKLLPSVDAGGIDDAK